MGRQIRPVELDKQACQELEQQIRRTKKLVFGCAK